MRLRLGTGAHVALVFVVLGCPSDDPGASGSSIGPEGGTIELSQGGSIEIPAGALETTVQIGAVAYDMTATADFTPLGPFYELSPHGVTFAKPVTVRLPVPSEISEPSELAQLAIVWAHAPGEWEWSLTSIDTDARVAVGTTTSFSALGLSTLRLLAGLIECESDDDCGGLDARSCVGTQIVSIGCIDARCRLRIEEDCAATGRICYGVECTANECTSPNDCPGAGLTFCLGNVLYQSSCGAGVCSQSVVSSCVDGEICWGGVCKENQCLFAGVCPNFGLPYCSSGSVSKWNCGEDGVCTEQVEVCSLSDKVCSAGACVTPP